MKLIHADALQDGLALILRHPRAVLAASALCAAIAALEALVFSLTGEAGPGLIGVTLLFILGFHAWVIAAVLVTRPALGLAEGDIQDRARDVSRLVLVAGLTLVLVLTVLGTAFVMLAFMLGALAILGAERTGLTEPPEGFVNIFALFSTAEWIIAVALIAVFAGFALWFISRLLPGIPATLARGKVQLLAAWPILQGRGLGGFITGTLAVLPGIVLLVAFAFLVESVTGYNPAQGVRADGLNPLGIALLRAVLVGGSVAFGLTPLLGTHARLYMKFTSQSV
ncbi:hypothetical protein X907_1453 [Glycocaulis alkaliphilus]|uniref:Uncharacterized protein n=1 Tax=Glycocaulis alkaliphilus TaxID=1434191 RepID=A0A3T0E9W7_9PROT|nr:hypothetical protein [Glycocaulis alkaliphilus]AZU03986.1 hypothetical protein X907_1453 [Glycocaulis alkaliphilus]GGB74865.1 hypothetical protein GCM10007417_13350 [Glycocaulis alkaliphilus]